MDTGIHVEQRVKTSGEISYNYSLYAGSMPFGAHIVSKATSSSAVQTKNIYYHTDHLGSIIAMTDDAGVVIERRSYDAWGKRRNANGTPMSNAFVTGDIRHAFTGHQDLGEVGLIHMNGRIYDPAIGRFMSADPHIQYPSDMQNYNRYSYINNNPLSAVDYSGYGWNPFKSAAKLWRNTVGRLLRNKVVQVVGQIAASVVGGPKGAALFAAASSYAQTGSLTDALTAGVRTYASAEAFNQVGHGGIFDEGSFGQYAAHAAVGCASQAAGGGSCRSGALAATFTKAAGGQIDGIDDSMEE